MKHTEIIGLLNAGCAVYGLSAGSEAVARVGINSAGMLWMQLGGLPHLAGRADELKQDGCGWRLTDPHGRELIFVLPEDADDWELGELITRLGEDRALSDHDQQVMLLGDDA